MDLLPDQKPSVATRSDTDFPGEGFSVHSAVSSTNREEIVPNPKDKRGGLNIASPPTTGSDFLKYKVPNLTHFGLGVLCLLVIFFGAKNFSFTAYHSEIRQFVQTVERGATIAVRNISFGVGMVGQNLTARIEPYVSLAISRWSRFIHNQFTDQVYSIERTVVATPLLFAKDVGQRLLSSVEIMGHFALAVTGQISQIAFTVGGETGDTLAGIRAVGVEFFSGVQSGRELAVDSWRQTLSTSQNFMLRGFGTARLAVKESVIDANREFLLTKKTVLAGLLTWPKNLSAERPLSGRQLAHFILPKSIMAKLAAWDSQAISASVINSELDVSAGSSSPATSSLLNQNGRAVLARTLFWARYVFESTVLPIVVTSYNESIGPVRQPVNNGLALFMDTGRGWSDDVTIAWNNFFGALAGDTLSQTALREQLKNEILDELKQENSVMVTDGTDDSILGATGIVVMKPSGSTTLDIKNVHKLQQAFSDRAIVNFDQSGQTGIIQPIFRDRVGEKYLFVITSIKK